MTGEQVVRRPFWSVSGDGVVATWLHRPTGERRRGAAVICPPMGHEYTHSHRSLRRLADALAADGVPTLRFDYRGTGDSSGDALDPGMVERWLADVSTVIATARQHANDGPVVLIGLRLGAMFACLGAAAADVEYLVAWSPVVVGRRYVRERVAVARTGAARQLEPGVLEAGGFRMSDDTANELRDIDLTEAPTGMLKAVLVVDRDDLPTQDTLFRSLDAAGVECTTIVPPGYADMMAEPQDTRVPTEAIATIVRWVGDHLGAPENVHASVEATGGGAERTVAPVVASGTLEEEMVWIRSAERPLFGVVTRPLQGTAKGPPLLLANSGSVHHVGPNRVYVELARTLAAQGRTTLRFDLRNLGDSASGECSDDNHPYPKTAVADIEAAAEWLAGHVGAPGVIVGGICSGAYGAFHAAADSESAAIAGLLPINPLTFFWEPGMTLAIPSAERTARDASHYKRSLRDTAKWKKMLKGDSDVRYIAGFIGRLAAGKVAGFGYRLLESARLVRPSRLASELMRIEARGRKISFVFSRPDPGYGLLKDGAGRTMVRQQRRGVLDVRFVEDADHTFSRSRWRGELAARVAEALDGFG